MSRAGRIGVGDRIRFLTDTMVYEWISPAVLSPYVVGAGCELVLVAKGSVGRIEQEVVTAPGSFQTRGERVFRVVVEGLPVVCVCPGREGGRYRRVVEPET